MKKVFLILLLTVSLFGNCRYYLSESQRYNQQANFQVNRQMYDRYIQISKKYWIQYQECLRAELLQKQYQGYRSNQINR